MREFEKMLAYLDAADMQHSAAELLEILGLSAGEKPKAAAGVKPVPETERAGGSEAENTAETKADAAESKRNAEGTYPVNVAEESEAELQRRSAEMEKAWLRQAKPDTAEVVYMAGDKRAGVNGAFGVVNGGKAGSFAGRAEEKRDETLSVRAFSDFFKRDSRRYDKGFQRY